jgi:hypothetical protein
VISHRRTHAPANTVTINGSAQHLAHGEAYARIRAALVLAVKGRHVPGKMLSPVFVHHLKVSMLQ